MKLATINQKAKKIRIFKVIFLNLINFHKNLDKTLYNCILPAILLSAKSK